MTKKSILCLPTLISRLSNKTTMDPFSVLNLYKGDDWRKAVSVHPVSLWKNDYMELVIKNWQSGEKYLYRNNFSTVHTKVLEGSFYSRMCAEKHRLHLRATLYQVISIPLTRFQM